MGVSKLVPLSPVSGKFGIEATIPAMRAASYEVRVVDVRGVRLPLVDSTHFILKSEHHADLLPCSVCGSTPVMVVRQHKCLTSAVGVVYVDSANIAEYADYLNETAVHSWLCSAVCLLCASRKSRDVRLGAGLFGWADTFYEAVSQWNDREYVGWSYE